MLNTSYRIATSVDRIESMDCPRGMFGYVEEREFTHEYLYCKTCAEKLPKDELNHVRNLVEEVVGGDHLYGQPKSARDLACRLACGPYDRRLIKWVQWHVKQHTTSETVQG